VITNYRFAGVSSVPNEPLIIVYRTAAFLEPPGAKLQFDSAGKWRFKHMGPSGRTIPLDAEQGSDQVKVVGPDAVNEGAHNAVHQAAFIWRVGNHRPGRSQDIAHMSIACWIQRRGV